MRKSPVTFLVFTLAVCCTLSTVWAGYPIIGLIDLYPQGAEFSQDLFCYKGVVYYTAQGGNTLFSIDVSDPTNPVLLDYLSETAKNFGVKVVEDIAYVASWGSGVRIYDVSNPSNIIARSHYKQSGDPAYWDVDVNGDFDRAYALASQATCGAGYDCGIRIIDVSNTYSPTLVSLFEGDHYNEDAVAVRGSYAYYTDSKTFKVVNISDETNPQLVAQRTYSGVSLLTGICLRGDYAYVSGSQGSPGLIIFDISNPTNPTEVSQLPYGSVDIYVMGDYAFLPTNVGGVYAINVSDPYNPTLFSNTNVESHSDAIAARETAVTGNGKYVYVATDEEYWNGNNYYKGKVYVLDVFGQDPDDTGPERWRDISTGEASWDTQYLGDALPTSADPAWKIYAGSETWAGVADGKLRVNDTGTGTGDRIRWWRNWTATNTHGATVMVRAKCDSYVLGGGGEYPGNIQIEDGKGKVALAILSDEIRVILSGQVYALDGTQWHTYRIATQGSTFMIYVDDLPAPVITGFLSMSTNRARVMFGSDSGPARQNIYFDYVSCCPNGPFGPASINDPSPDVAVLAYDTAGKGSLSGILPSSVYVYWSTDGGETWDSSGGPLWDVQYEANELPTAASPSWTEPEGNNVNDWIDAGILHVEDTSTAGGSKVKWARSWNVSPSTGATLFTRMKCNSAGGDPTYYGNLFIDDGAYRERFAILTDRIEAKEAGIVYNDGGTFDGTLWHQYRITTKNSQFTVYVDEDPTPVMTGSMGATSTQNRVMFGVGASSGTQYVEFDYVRYSTVGELLPGQGDGGGAVTVTCGGQPGDDRGWVTAYDVPFNQESRTLNKIQFALRDMNNNTGYSPIYNVAIVNPPSPDFDRDNDVDQEDFGLLQRCFSGDGVPYDPICEKADLDLDWDVDLGDLDIFQDCVNGPNNPKALTCPL